MKERTFKDLPDDMNAERKARILATRQKIIDADIDFKAKNQLKMTQKLSKNKGE